MDDAALLASDLTDVYYKNMQSLFRFRYVDSPYAAQHVQRGEGCVHL